MEDSFYIHSQAQCVQPSLQQIFSEEQRAKYNSFEQYKLTDEKRKLEKRVRQKNNISQELERKNDDNIKVNRSQPIIGGKDEYSYENKNFNSSLIFNQKPIISEDQEVGINVKYDYQKHQNPELEQQLIQSCSQEQLLVKKHTFEDLDRTDMQIYRSKWMWICFAFLSLFFTFPSQYGQARLSISWTSIFTLSLGNLTFVCLYLAIKMTYIMYYYKPSINPFSRNKKNKGFLIILVIINFLARFATNFFKIWALSECTNMDINGGIVYVFRNTEGIFISIGAYFFLKEVLTPFKILGLVLLAFGVAGLGYFGGDQDAPGGPTSPCFIIISTSMASALSSTAYNFTTKKLGQYKFKGEFVTITSMGGANLLAVIIGLILMFNDSGFAAESHGLHEFTIRRYLISVIIGAGQFFGLYFVALAIQFGYSGPAVVIKNSSYLFVILLFSIINGEDISKLQWVFAGVVFFGMAVISLGDYIFLILTSKKEEKKENV